VAYSPTNWVNRVTTLGPTNLNKLENGLQAAAAVADAALPASADAKLIYDAKGDILVALSDNTPQKFPVGPDGYGLQADSTQPLGLKWVAMPQAGIPQTILDAKGDIVAATANDTPAKVTVGADGTVLMADAASAPGVKWQTQAALALQQQAQVTVGTTLPASPVDGQEAILVDSLTAPTYNWRFKYVAGITADAYKWVFIGGDDAFSEVVASETPNSATYVALATPGPSITVPRAGIYVVEIGFLMQNISWGGGFAQYMSYDIGATGAVDADGTGAMMVNITTTASLMVSRPRVKTFTSGPTALVAKYRHNSATTNYPFAQRWMRVVPKRVS